ncbi:MAG TPA: prepilin-type N-terminal cleavage/methylation domain-containing protein [Gemmatimonadaceae bacterium]|nr:prepilin-type N-terminal cleavage/methylation domain-containing protein [Gemmatimonadaceae bacterium]
MPDRRGFSLVEVVIAMLVFAVGGLGLAASAAAIAKQISASGLRADAATIARSRAEAAHGSTCGSFAGGDEIVAGVRSFWSIGESTLDQHLDRSDAFGSHADRFISAVPCD